MEASTQIEKLISTFLHHLVNNTIMSFNIPRGDSIDDIYQLDCDQTSENNHIVRRLEKVESSRKYAQMFAVVALVAELISVNKTISQRDVYYTLKTIFRNQKECNSIVIEVGLVLGLKRHEMGICPASKGYVAGDLSFRSGPNEVWTSCLESSPEGGLPIASIWTFAAAGKVPLEMRTSARVILVVEKEGIFHRLCEDRIFERIPCILITACGFPDIATRSLLHFVSSTYEEMEVIGICDFNPCGVGLLLTYKFGSISMAFEGRGLEVYRLQWMAMRWQHVEHLRVSLQGSDEFAQPLTSRDKKKLENLLASKYMQTVSTAFKNELEVMLQQGTKYELESLYSIGITYISDVVLNAVYNRDFI
mmetsp:Transcript_11922/g.18026  ORF Transcript_11922/g.18026 Transcript_11922/m.18026 type:complete len:363 (-) Transcript_11922:117-1205(-)